MPREVRWTAVSRIFTFCHDSDTAGRVQTWDSRHLRRPCDFARRNSQSILCRASPRRSFDNRTFVRQTIWSAGNSFLRDRRRILLLRPPSASLRLFSFPLLRRPLPAHFAVHHDCPVSHLAHRRQFWLPSNDIEPPLFPPHFFSPLLRPHLILAFINTQLSIRLPSPTPSTSV